jgi:hypothetical protein
MNQIIAPVLISNAFVELLICCDVKFASMDKSLTSFKVTNENIQINRRNNIWDANL